MKITYLLFVHFALFSCGGINSNNKPSQISTNPTTLTALARCAPDSPALQVNAVQGEGYKFSISYDNREFTSLLKEIEKNNYRSLVVALFGYQG